MSRQQILHVSYPTCANHVVNLAVDAVLRDIAVLHVQLSIYLVVCLLLLCWWTQAYCYQPLHDQNANKQ